MAFDPAENLKKLQKEFNKVFDKVNENLEDFWKTKVNTGKAPSSDITHDAKEVTISFHLYGIKKENVVVFIEDDKVMLEAENKVRKKGLTSVERFTRDISLPAGLEVNKARRRWNGSTLIITIPKKRKN